MERGWGQTAEGSEPCDKAFLKWWLPRKSCKQGKTWVYCAVGRYLGVGKGDGWKKH